MRDEVHAKDPVLIVTPWYRPAVGGVAEVSESLRSGLVRSGVEAHLLIVDETQGMVEDQVLTNVWRMAIPSYLFGSLRPRAFLGTVVRGLPALWRLYRFVRSRRIRTVLLVFPIGYAWPFILLRVLVGFRLIASLHGSEVRRYPEYAPQFRWLLRRTLNAAAVITVPSPQLAATVDDWFPEVSDRVKVIPNGVDTRRFVPADRDAGHGRGPATVVHISNFAPLKRTLDIVDAFAAADLPTSARLVFVGHGPSLAATRERARMSGVADRTDFVGAVNDVRSVLDHATVLVLLSDFESSGLVLLEAMACGVPWVATPFGVATQVPDGECGLVVPTRAPRIAAQAISTLVNNPECARAMGDRGREIATREYSIQTYVSRHLELLGE